MHYTRRALHAGTVLAPSVVAHPTDMGGKETKADKYSEDIIIEKIKR